MIQRIQTVYLLIAEMLIGALFFVPFAEIAGKEGSIYRFDMKGIYLEGVQKTEIIYSSLPLVILWTVSLMLILATVVIGIASSIQGWITLLPLRSSVEQDSWLISTVSVSVIIASGLMLVYGSTGNFVQGPMPRSS